MIRWWGPILAEYYGATEQHGTTMITADEWLTKRGSVGRAALGILHICDDAGTELSATLVGFRTELTTTTAALAFESVKSREAMGESAALFEKRIQERFEALQAATRLTLDSLKGEIGFTSVQIVVEGEIGMRVPVVVVMVTAGVNLHESHAAFDQAPSQQQTHTIDGLTITLSYFLWLTLHIECGEGLGGQQ